MSRLSISFVEPHPPRPLASPEPPPRGDERCEERAPLRVLMTTDAGSPLWTLSCELATGLAAFGVETTLVAMGAPLTGAQRRAIAALPGVDVVETELPLDWSPTASRDVDAAGDWLLATAHRTGAEVVHLGGLVHAARPFGVPVVVGAHGSACAWYRAVRRCEAPPAWDDYRRRASAGLRAADVVVAPSRAALDAMLDAHGVDARGRVIPHGRSAGPWRPRDKEPFVLGIGRWWDDARGLVDLDSCAPVLDWRVCIAGPRGDGRAAPRGAYLAGELAADELAALAGRASIYALPARYEPFGLSILEAALAGCALVLGDLPALRETWQDDAVYVPPGDRGALVAALRALGRDPARRVELADRAIARAHTLTAHRMATAYRELYDELVMLPVEVCA